MNNQQKITDVSTLRFLLPSAWGMTPEQRIARLRLYLSLVKGRKGKAQEQAARWLAEIEEIQQTYKDNPCPPA